LQLISISAYNVYKLFWRDYENKLKTIHDFYKFSQTVSHVFIYVDKRQGP